ncbi:MAG: Cof-type HAD-IIB family hydrolase [Leptotrichiaceae bacterium]|nr:Cof-type HAD-IIB family hydrolase [Leptotrichiaceae bacterium]
MIKLIAIDMDGTLLNQKKEISFKQKEALKEAEKKGIMTVLCTGRPLFGVIPFYKELELEKTNGYIIVNNGCSIHKTEDLSLTDYNKLAKKDIEYLYSLTEGYDVNFTLFDDKHYFCIGKPNEYTEYDGKLVYVPITEITLKEVLCDKYMMFQSMYVGSPENVDKFQKDNQENLKKLYSIVRSQTYILEAMPFGVEKGSAVKRLSEKLGIKREEVMAIGDGNNDIEMLRYAEISVAMENGTEDVKKAAKYITESNENDGVAKAIYKYALSQPFL